MRVGYLVHDLNDAAVLRRARMLEMGSAQVELAGFARDMRLREGIATREPLVLGQSKDAAFIQRASLALRKALANGELKERFADCDVVIARNLEQLAIAARIVGSRPLVYECLDIHRLLLGSSVPARIVQRLEAALLPRCDMLITSSPAFISNHFSHRPISAPIELVENKLLLDPEDPPAKPSSALDRSGPLVVGWFGMLRCKRTLGFLEDLVEAAEGRIKVLIAGKPSLAEVPDLVERAQRNPHIDFHGAYTYTDLPELYGRCDFAWSVDWFEEGLNSAWLLPNRLYEAITYGCVPIALTDVEVGRWLAAHDAGLIVADAADAKSTLLEITREQASALRREIEAIPSSKTTADTTDCTTLVERLEELVV